MVDDHSRRAYSEIHDDEKAETCAAFLTRAAASFAELGITTIERVMTDNAFAYRHGRAFIDAVAVLGAKQVFIKAHCPWQNGKVERFNRTPAERVGLPARLPQQPSPPRRPCALAEHHEHSTTPQRTRRPPPDRPTVTNLNAEYT